jgi:hypothetical protein
MGQLSRLKYYANERQVVFQIMVLKMNRYDEVVIADLLKQITPPTHANP